MAKYSKLIILVISDCDAGVAICLGSHYFDRYQQCDVSETVYAVLECYLTLHPHTNNTSLQILHLTSAIAASSHHNFRRHFVMSTEITIMPVCIIVLLLVSTPETVEVGLESVYQTHIQCI